MKRPPRSRAAAGAKLLSHVAADGSMAMVDVTAKTQTHRAAMAQALVRMNATAWRALREGVLKKGDALAAARVAGIMAAKRTSELIPLCHTLELSHVDVQCALTRQRGVRVTCSVATFGPTGAEMEALTGASVAALTIYDMCKAIDRSIVIERVVLMTKSGGASGTFVRHGSE
jgi:molybdenum cofactor biosynthesis protein MoaC